MPPPPSRAAAWIFCVTVLLAIVAEAARVYWIMPFPGSQRGDTLALAYGIDRWIWVLRCLCAVVATVAAAAVLLARRSWQAWLAVLVGLAAVALVAYQTNGPMSADVMFRQPSVLRFAGAGESSLDPAAVVVAIAVEDDVGATHARAYPLQVIGYHHQVRDVVAGRPVMVTYCTVCRTGRVYSPVVRGEADEFRLVGMDHFNAMFEDARTGSWWRQATGEAVAGPLRGERLSEIRSWQTSWADWLAQHPESDALEPDPRFAEQYARLDGFAEGTNESSLTGRDPTSWGEKSWVVGVVAGSDSRAFDWNELVRAGVIADQVGATPVLLVASPDELGFVAFDARPAGTGDPITLERREDGVLVDGEGWRWSESGRALEGPRSGQRLDTLPAYQEFWHSWRTFHPETTVRR